MVAVVEQMFSRISGRRRTSLSVQFSSLVLTVADGILVEDGGRETDKADQTSEDRTL